MHQVIDNKEINKEINKEKAAKVGRLLIHWAAQKRRPLAWRNDQNPNAYHVWLAEIMLQQTTYATVQNRFTEFIHAFPTLQALAQAEQPEVLEHWAGLGYYARARNLHRCARLIVEQYGGSLPDQEAELRKLPGIGRYTAAAIAAIAFNHPSIALEANSKRIFARLEHYIRPLDEQNPALQQFFLASSQGHSPRLHLQAWMDFGEIVCRARQPQCHDCILRPHCAGWEKAENLPIKSLKKPKKQLFAHAYWLHQGQQTLLYRRPEKGLLGGMLSLPMSSWQDDYPALPTIHDTPCQWHAIGHEVKHEFTHISLKIRLFILENSNDVAQQRIAEILQFIPLPKATTQVLAEDNPLGFPSLMKKVIAQVRQKNLHSSKAKFLRLVTSSDAD